MSEIRGFHFAFFRPVGAVFLLVPRRGISFYPICHSVYTLSGFGGDEEDLDARVAHLRVRDDLFPVEVEIGHHIHLVDDQQLAGLVHQGGISEVCRAPEDGQVLGQTAPTSRVMCLILRI